ncbi:MAG: nicotinate (nicotinamide) nucleotide adenylyltransferase [Candidatus Aureabacteria bacterium]|nr:nicotinate (nicotinamide) nucleotide adenylyltransferase [Candidatus Auribacterota bacterium]
MKIGIFGGTFDPVHVGHVQCARFVLDEQSLDEILFVVSGNPPHKRRKITSVSHRLRMLELSLQNDPKLAVSHIEIKRSAPYYSIETMRLFKKEQPQTRFFFILGDDNMGSIHTWHDYQSFIEENEFILLKRETDFPENFRLTEKEKEKIKTHAVNSPTMPCSSTMIREKIKRKESVSEWIDPKVFDYILAHHLYGV